MCFINTNKLKYLFALKNKCKTYKIMIVLDCLGEKKAVSIIKIKACIKKQKWKIGYKKKAFEKKYLDQSERKKKERNICKIRKTSKNLF